MKRSKAMDIETIWCPECKRWTHHTSTGKCIACLAKEEQEREVDYGMGDRHDINTFGIKILRP